MNDVLIAFVEARLADDERVARAVAGSGTWAAYLEGGDDGWAIESTPGGSPSAIVGDEAMTRHMTRHDPEHVLRDVESKRAILAQARAYSPELEHGDNGEWAFGLALGLLAKGWSDHPDYDPRWADVDG